MSLVQNQIQGDGNVSSYIKEYATYLDGLDGTKKQNLAQIYHNIDTNRSHSLFESWNTGTQSTGLNGPYMNGALPQPGLDPTLGGQFAPIVFALSRFTFPNLIGNEICGVQALPGPVGQAFCVKFRMQDQDIQNGSVPGANGARWNGNGADGRSDVNPLFDGDMDAGRGLVTDGIDRATNFPGGAGWDTGMLVQSPDGRLTDPVTLGHFGVGNSRSSSAAFPNWPATQLGMGMPNQQQPMANWNEVPDYVGYSGAGKGTSGTGFDGVDFDSSTSTAWGYTMSSASLDKIGGMATLGNKNTGVPGTEFWGITKNWGNLDTKTPELTFDMGLVTIETKDRHLAASFNVKTQMYAKYMQGFDVERELFNAVHYHVLAEIDRETLLRARFGAYKRGAMNANGTVAVAPSPNATSFFSRQYNSQSPFFTYTCDCAKLNGNWMQQVFAGVVNFIIRACNDIGRRNHRGAGNFVVVSPNIATVLQQSGEWFSGTNVNVNASTVVPEIGTINGNIKVFVDRYAKDDVCLVGYKGPGVADAGLIFGPFSMGLELRAISPNDFATRIGVLSQYGFVNNLLGPDLYYSTIAFANVESLWSRAIWQVGGTITTVQG